MKFLLVIIDNFLHFGNRQESVIISVASHWTVTKLAIMAFLTLKCVLYLVNDSHSYDKLVRKVKVNKDDNCSVFLAN